MEHIQESLQLESPINTAPFRRSPYLRLIVMAVAGFALGNIGAAALAQATVPPANPFLEYADLFPGQSVSAVNARSFSCHSTNNYYESEETCASTVASGVVASIDIVISEGLIGQTTFTLRDNTFKVGDLILLFGESALQTYPHRAYFSWQGFFLIVSTTARGNPAAIRPVWSVTFTNA